MLTTFIEKTIVSGNNTVPTSVMKSSIWITFEEKNELQKDKCYAPAKWMWRDKNHVGSGLAKKLSEPSRNFSLTRDS